jgi:arylformamidase
MGAHTGTHMDAQLHFFQKGKGIHIMPLSVAMGQARVIEIRDPESIKPEELRPHQIQRRERILFKTRNSPRCWQTDEFVEDFVYISQEAARYLAAQQVQTVGIDYLSVGGFFKDGVETHHALLEAGIWLIEGFNLSEVEPGTYELICLPLKIVDADGAPARAILRLVS